MLVKKQQLEPDMEQQTGSKLGKEYVKAVYCHSVYLTYMQSTSGEGNGNPLQYSCLENPMDRGAWEAAVHGVAKSRTQLSDFTFTFTFICISEVIDILLAILIPACASSSPAFLMTYSAFKLNKQGDNIQP